MGGELLTRFRKFMLAAALAVSLGVGVVAATELRLLPLAVEGAKSHTRLYVSELLADAVESTLEPEPRLIEVVYGDGEVKAIETNIAAITRLRSGSVKAAAGELSSLETREMRIPVGSLTGSTLLGGRGFELSVRILPVGDVTGELYSELVESGINQTLHRIYLRMRVTVKLVVAARVERIELANDVLVAETVIVGRVPDAYTAINRFEIDESEENDLNDYAATLP